MANGPSKEQAQQELARRELARREAERIGQPGQAGRLAETGFIRERPPLLERLVGGAIGKAPEVGQMAGGLLGALTGGRVGAPVRGQIAGGTAGRMLGELIQRGARGELKDLGQTQLKQVGKEVLQSGGVALASEAAFGGAGKIAALGGQGMLGGLLGPRVAERGVEKGFKGLLDPRFFQNRVPKEISTKVNKFFGRLDNTVGKKVERAVLAKRNVQVPFKSIQSEHANILKSLGAESVEDFSTVQTSKSQIRRLKEVENIITRVRQDKVSLPALWKMRKKVDEVDFKGGRFSDDAKSYLESARGLLSAPLSRFGGKQSHKFNILTECLSSCNV